MNSQHFERNGPIRDIPHLTAPMSTRKLDGERKCCRAVTLLQRTRAIAVAGDDGIVKIYNMLGSRTKEFGTPHGRIFGVAEPAENIVITCGQDGSLCAWDVNSEPRLIDNVLVAPERAPCTKMFYSTEDNLLVGTETGRLALYSWNRHRLRSICCLPKAHSARIHGIHGYGSLFATAGKDRIVAIWSKRNLDHQEELSFRNQVFSVQLSDHFLAVGAANFIRLFHNERHGFAHITDIQIECGILWCLKFINNDILMACGEVTLNFVDTSGQYGVTERVQTSAKIIQDTELLPNGDVAVAGVGKEANAVIRLPSHIAEPVIEATDRIYCNKIPEETLKSSSNETSAENAQSTLTKADRVLTVYGIPVVPWSSSELPTRLKEKRDYNYHTRDLPVARGERSSSKKQSSLHKVEKLISNTEYMSRTLRNANDVKVNGGSSESRKSTSPFELVPSMVIMLRCKNTKITAEGLMKLESDDLANVLASFMLEYRMQWLSMFETLKKIIYRFLVEQMLLPEDIVGERAIDKSELIESMRRVLAGEENIVSILGHFPHSRFEEFLTYFDENQDIDLDEAKSSAVQPEQENRDS